MAADFGVGQTHVTPGPQRRKRHLATKALPEVRPLYIASKQVREMADTQVKVNTGEKDSRVSV